MSLLQKKELYCFRLLSELSFLVYKDRYSLGLKLTYNVSVSSRSYLFSYGCFRKGFIPWNKGVSVSSRSYLFSYGCFRKGFIPWNKGVSVSSRSYLFSYSFLSAINKLSVLRFPSPLGVIFSRIVVFTGTIKELILCFRLLSELSFLVFVKYFFLRVSINFSFRLLSELSFLVLTNNKV